MTVPPAHLAPRAVGAAGLGGVAALHALWGAGSTFPASDRASLADAVAGLPDMPAPRECYAVAVLLGTAALVTAGLGGGSRPAQAVRAAAATVLGARAVTGLTGTTAYVVPWQPSASFRRLDRRWYGPLCATLSTCCAAVWAEHRGMAE